MRAPTWRRFSRNRIFLIALVIVAALVAARAVLPLWLTHYVNGVMDGMPGYRGHIADVDLHIWRGAYSIRQFEIHQRDSQETKPVLTAEVIDLSVEWKALLHGALVGEIEFYRPRINVIAGQTRQEGRGVGDLARRFRQLMPMRINRFALQQAQLHFQNFSAQPDVDIYLDQVELEARNLTNSENLSESLAATVESEGRAMQSGRFKLDMRLDPFQKQPSFELAFELEHLSLPELNSFLRHYLAVVARDGVFSMYAESKAGNGRFQGYVKPVVRGLDILQIKQKPSMTESIKGFFVKIIDAVFKNKPKEQLATRVEFSGTFDDPDADVWEAVASFLRNAFVQALEPGVEGSVTPRQAQQVQRGKPETKK